MMFYAVKLAQWATRVRALLVQLEGAPADGRPIPAPSVEVVQPLGLRANPVVRESTEALVFELANGQRVAFVVDKVRQTGGVEPETGGVALVGDAAPATTIYLRASGDIEVTSASGRNVVVNAPGAGEVRLNGSALKVAADTDPVDLGSWTFSPGTSGASLSYTPPGGAATPITPAGAAVVGKVNVTAARRVKTSG
ncbi:MAG: hypothetical protein Q8S73_26570 [Deltaproteobacteria bacterium]|nr:hypothetical protein [Myxococcales bacterium]MDP3217700.1 hypothetical protein [Deltaproteobacteria bacterium]